MRLVFHQMTALPGGAAAFYRPYLERNEHTSALVEAGDRDAAAQALTDYLHDAEAALLAAYGTLAVTA